MKKLSLQWRITLMTAALVCITCVLMNCLISFSGKHYMESIVNGLSSFSDVENGEPDSFNPESKKADLSKYHKKYDQLRKRKIFLQLGASAALAGNTTPDGRASLAGTAGTTPSA